jgi:hypothetical protein
MMQHLATCQNPQEPSVRASLTKHYAQEKTSIHHAQHEEHQNRLRLQLRQPENELKCCRDLDAATNSWRDAQELC